MNSFCFRNPRVVDKNRETREEKNENASLTGITEVEGFLSYELKRKATGGDCGGLNWIGYWTEGAMLCNQQRAK